MTVGRVLRLFPRDPAAEVVVRWLGVSQPCRCKPQSERRRCDSLQATSPTKTPTRSSPPRTGGSTRARALMARFTPRADRGFTRSASASEVVRSATRSSPPAATSQRDTSSTQSARSGAAATSTSRSCSRAPTDAAWRLQSSTACAAFRFLPFPRARSFTRFGWPHRLRSGRLSSSWSRRTHDLDEVRMVLYTREDDKAYTVFAEALEQILSERATDGAAERGAAPDRGRT